MQGATRAPASWLAYTSICDGSVKEGEKILENG